MIGVVGIIALAIVRGIPEQRIFVNLIDVVGYVPVLLIGAGLGIAAVTRQRAVVIAGVSAIALFLLVMIAGALF